jgi:hypothetical protein
MAEADPLAMLAAELESEEVVAMLRTLRNGCPASAASAQSRIRLACWQQAESFRREAEAAASGRIAPMDPCALGERDKDMNTLPAENVSTTHQIPS